MQEEESTHPYGMSVSKEASRTSINNGTKTIIIEDLTCVPEDKEKKLDSVGLVYLGQMGLVARKPVFGVSDKARLKPVSSATKTI